MTNCPSNKKCWLTLEVAEANARRMCETNAHRKEKGKKKMISRVYRCRMCGFYHTTSKEQS